MNQFDNKLSIYIPRIAREWANTEDISRVFELYEIAIVDRVDLVVQKDMNGEVYYQGFVHFKEWYDTKATRHLQERILDQNRQARVVYNDPSYWIVLKNKNPMTEIEVRMEKRITELETNDMNQRKVAVYHLGRIMELETKILAMESQMNYWNDPTLCQWNNTDTTNTIQPLWCHPVNQQNEAEPIWNTSVEDLETGMTMDDYVAQTLNTNYEDSVSDYYNNYDYSIQIIQ